MKFCATCGWISYPECSQCRRREIANLRARLEQAKRVAERLRDLLDEAKDRTIVTRLPWET